MKTCARNHTYTGDENYRARSGCCPVCLREAQKRYNRTEKGLARRAAYERTQKALARQAKYRDTDKRADALARYDQSPKGWMNALRKRRTKALQRRTRRKEAEDS